MSGHSRNKALVFLGGLLCLAGVILLTGLLSFEQASSTLRGLLLGCASLLLAWGSVTLIFRHRPFVGNLNLSLISVAVLAPFVGELVIRSSISLGIDRFRDPQLYADPLSEDDYWKLRYSWNPRTLATTHKERFVVDRVLGWSPPRTPENPLGIVSDGPYSPDFSKPSVLFYGDSFVYGATRVPVPERIPQRLDRFLLDYTVYNYGVSAFGVDQIFLRFRKSHTVFQKPVIIFGILTEDIDRSILNVHSAPKPRFELREGRLDLQNTPLPEDPAAWYRRQPVTINSYFLALLRRTYQIVADGEGRRSDKETINHKIIEAVVEEARVGNAPIVFVIFYGPHELENETWREAYLKNLFKRLKVPYIDTKAVLAETAKKRSLHVREFYLYRYKNDHPNELGNCVIAAAIAEHLAESIAVETVHLAPESCFDSR